MNILATRCMTVGDPRCAAQARWTRVLVPMLLLAAAPAAFGQPSSAMSKATLEYTVTATCTLTTPSGTTTVPCSASGWGVRLEPGWTAMMTATWNWHYTDDGLPMNGGALMDYRSGFGGIRLVNHESAGIYVQSLPACGRAGCTPFASRVVGPGLTAVFESDNDAPEDVTGSRTLTITATWPATFGGPGVGTLGFFNPGVFVNSVPAIPEPSTWAMFATLLATLACIRRRRATKGVPVQGVTSPA